MPLLQGTVLFDNDNDDDNNYNNNDDNDENDNDNNNNNYNDANNYISCNAFQLMMSQVRAGQVLF